MFSVSNMLSAQRCKRLEDGDDALFIILSVFFQLELTVLTRGTFLLKSASRAFPQHTGFFSSILTENNLNGRRQADMSSINTQSFSASYDVKLEFHTNTLLLLHSCPSYLPVMCTMWQQVMTSDTFMWFCT